MERMYSLKRLLQIVIIFFEDGKWKYYLIARIKRDGEFVIETIELNELQYRTAKEGDLI